MIPAAEVLAAMARLPFEPVATLLDAGPILVLAPHPDDESLGCGGLIAAACGAGSAPFVLVLTDGTGSHPNSRAYPARRLRDLREQEALAATAELGLKPDRIGFLRLTDTRSPVEGPEFTAATSAIVDMARRHGAATILAPWRHDPHGDHLSAHLLAAACAEVAGLRHLGYPVWGLTLSPQTLLPGPLPTGLRIDIKAHLAAKRRAIAAHRSQYAGVIVDDPHGFQLPPSFVEMFERPFETFLEVRADGDQPAKA